MAALDADVTALGEAGGEAAPLAQVPPSGAVLAAEGSAAAPGAAATASAEAAAASAPALPTDPTAAALCIPISANDPCGPDLDYIGDAAYLNFFAQVEGVLPTAFFDPINGAPFDRASVDLPGQLDAIKPLVARSRDIRLFIMQARLQILNRDLAGFAASLAAVSYWLEAFWDQVHPRPEGGDVAARSIAISALDPQAPYTPTVLFPLQYAPLFESRRLGAVSYRRWMIANGEVAPRGAEDKTTPAAISDALAQADPDKLAATRAHVLMVKSALDRVRKGFAAHGLSSGLESLPALVAKIHAFVDPVGAAEAAVESESADREDADADAVAAKPSWSGPKCLADASTALAAIADYYARLEPSSPTLPLVRQAHQLIGKSFLEVMSILVPTQMEKAAFQIGNEQVFDLPVGRLADLSQVAPAGEAWSEQNNVNPNGGGVNPNVGYDVQTRAQAISLLEQVQRFFRSAEPSSPVPMLCDRARTLAERDFMGVLRDVLPKTALKNAGADK